MLGQPHNGQRFGPSDSLKPWSKAGENQTPCAFPGALQPSLSAELDWESQQVNEEGVKQRVYILPIDV